MFIKQRYSGQARFSGEHARWIDRGWLHTSLEVAVENSAGRTVHAHASLFKPDGTRTDLLHLPHVMSGHEDRFTLAQQGGEEGQALLPECRVALFQDIVPDQDPRVQESHRP